MKLVVGLGNPGKEYADTRHNVGFRCIDHLARQHRISLTQRQCRSQLGRGELAGIPVVLAKPRTFMNPSGEAVRLLVQKFLVPVADLVVIHDDLDLPPGVIRLRQGGSSGGHKGVESIISCLGSRDFLRLRVGIGRPQGQDAITYVLSLPAPEEKKVIEETFVRVAAALSCLLTQGIETAMNQFNRREKPEEGLQPGSAVAKALGEML